MLFCRLKDKNQQMSKRVLGLAAAAIAVIGVIVYFVLPSQNQTPKQEQATATEVVPVVEEEPAFLFDIPLKGLEVKEGMVKRNQTFADILEPYKVSRKVIFDIDRKSKKVFSVRNFVPGKKYTLLYESDSVDRATHFIYQPNALEYVVYQLKDDVKIYMGEHEMEIKEATMAGKIDISLDHAIKAEGGTSALVSRVADVFGWQIDFRSLQKGDWFKIIYEEKYVNGEFIGVGEVLGAEFNHVKSTYMAYAFDDGEGLNYYDQDGESLQRAFLRYPVEYSRISSRYNPRRFHPILKRTTPHLGTDYAAARNTEIKAAGDGVIIAKGFTKPNGNYIKIKHNGTYTTGYLHMNKFARVKKGQKVKKGQVIGYVGKTGYATGYHLCFRFWKRGKQVDFLKEKLPAQKPLTEEQLLKFEAIMELTNKKLDDIPKAWAGRDITVSAD